jgi:nucleoside-diphosphate-sugar epimerase
MARLTEPVLVTGGSSFLGRGLLRRLTAEHRVLAPRSADLDLRDWESTVAYFQAHRPGTVFHLAGSTLGRFAGEDFLQVFQANTLATAHVLEACRRLGHPRLVVAGTGDENGADSGQPAGPLSAYAASKAAGTLICQAASRFSELQPTVLRFFAVYGPGQSSDFLVPSLLRALRTGHPLAMTEGEQRRDFVWLDDALEVLLAVAGSASCQGKTLDVCTGVTHSLREVVELVSTLGGRALPVSLGALPYRRGEPFLIAGDPFPLRSLVGPLLQTSLREGLARLLAEEPDEHSGR